MTALFICQKCGQQTTSPTGHAESLCASTLEQKIAEWGAIAGTEVARDKSINLHARYVAACLRDACAELRRLRHLQDEPFINLDDLRARGFVPVSDLQEWEKRADAAETRLQDLEEINRSITKQRIRFCERADNAEARVRELEAAMGADLAGDPSRWSSFQRGRADAAEARCAVNRDALLRICEVDYETYEALQSTCVDIAREAIAIPDHAADALLARLKAAEDGMRAVVRGISKLSRPQEWWAAHDAWLAAGGK